MAYIRCWTCNGGGVVRFVRDIEICPDCNGTGCDFKKTKTTNSMTESEKTYPKPITLKCNCCGKLPCSK